MFDFSHLDDEQLDQLRVDLLTEQERRINLAHIPAQVTELAKKYRNGGGNDNDLMDAVRTPSPEDN